MCDTSPVPIVDLSGCEPGSPREASTASVVRDACYGAGFFYVVGHGVPDALIDETFRASAAFFALPVEAKLALSATAQNARGYTAVAAETLDPAKQSRGDTKEGFYIGRELEPGEPENAIERRGGNQWPDANAATASAPGMAQWRATMEAYFAALHTLAMRLLRLVALALDLPPTYFDTAFQRPMETLRLVKYTSEVSSPTSGVLSCGEHTDYGMLTLLKTDDVPGLEVLLRDDESNSDATNAPSDDAASPAPGNAGGRWVPVPPRRDAFIVNLGDMLQRWSNDTVRSTLHRVVNTHGRERYSTPFFFEPCFHAVVECLPHCVDNTSGGRRGGRPRHPPITSGAYLLQRYAKTYDWKRGEGDEEGNAARTNSDA